MKLKDLYEAVCDLSGGPETVDGNFNCNGRELTTLRGGPKVVYGDYRCDYNELTDLIGAPDHVGGGFSCQRNELTSLEGAPKFIDGPVYVNANKLSSLKDVHKRMPEINGSFVCKSNPLRSHVLGVLLIKGMTDFRSDDMVLNNIIDDAFSEFPEEDSKSLKQRLMYASRRLIDELPNGKEFAKL